MVGARRSRVRLMMMSCAVPARANRAATTCAVQCVLRTGKATDRRISRRQRGVLLGGYSPQCRCQKPRPEGASASAKGRLKWSQSRECTRGPFPVSAVLGRYARPRTRFDCRSSTPGGLRIYTDKASVLGLVRHPCTGLASAEGRQEIPMGCPPWCAGPSGGTSPGGASRRLTGKA